ncbi:electron transfer flavoprotein subunit alpha/FixB family protein [Calditrichota bacterium]
MSNILVLAEQRAGEIKKIAFENISVAKKLSADLGGETIAVLIGKSVASLASELGEYGADKVAIYQNDKLEMYNSDGYAKILSDAVSAYGAKIVIMGATAMGKDLAPKVAAKVGGALATDVVSVEAENGNLKIIRPMYAGKVRTTIRLTSDIKLLTIRPNVYIPEENAGAATVEEKTAEPGDFKAIIKEIITGAKDKLDVTEADIIVSGGRGMKGPENFNLIEDLAGKLGAATGASRAAVDAGWRPYDEQVGQTGKTVSPSLYVAVGISGAIQHLAGMSSSKYIVAINKDPEAPIFKVADYGIVGDLFEVVPKMIEVL